MKLSDAEINALLAAALSLPPSGALRRWTHHGLFGVIAVTGMRLSRAINLKCDDIDLDAGVLTIRLTKFGKSRLVPLHPTTSAALRNYAQLRDSHLTSQGSPNFFVANAVARCCTSTVIASSGACRVRLVCDCLAIMRDLA